MSQFNVLDNAQVVLLATALITESDLPRFQVLSAARNDVLSQSLICRLLITYLPIDIHSQPALISFLNHLLHNFKDVSELDIVVDISTVQRLSRKEIQRQLHELRLDRLEDLHTKDDSDVLSTFVRQWIYGLESTIGLSGSVLELADTIADGRPEFQHWCDTYLVPTIRLSCEFYPERADAINIPMVESLQGLSGVKTLMQFAVENGDQAKVGRDLEEVVTPWVQGASRSKRRRVDGVSSSEQHTSWQDVNEWIYGLSSSNFSLAANAVIEWSGPVQGESEGRPDQTISTSGAQFRLRYAQTCIALVLASSLTGLKNTQLFNQVLDRAAAIWAAEQMSDDNADLATQSSRADLLHNALLRPKNPLTTPSHASLHFLKTCVLCQEKLESFKLPMTVVAIADIALFGSEDRQKQELDRIIQRIPQMTRDTINWTETRLQIKNLQKLENLPIETVHFLGRLSSAYLETELLDAMLKANQSSVVREIYLTSSESPLSRDIVRSHIISAIFDAYDNASNGNRTRGGMKRAYEILKAFQYDFKDSKDVASIEHLIKATHSLSFYHITLQHGVPFQPVNIRANKDPLSLVGKVLEQNPKAYTKLDDLIEIGQNLVQAGLSTSSEATHEEKTQDELIFDATHRVTYLAITAALSDNDFDTAYSYITTRLSTKPTNTSNSDFTDDTSWRAAYAAGKHRPSASPKSLHERITSLAQRMDLLAVALTLAPTAEPLSEILATWRRSEEEMASLRSQAIEEERAFEAQGSNTIPGGFGPEDRELDAAETRRLMERRAIGGSSPTYEEEAPMGLFDVARGAASALRKTAFPLGAKGVGSDGFRVRDNLRQDSSPRSSLDERITPQGEQRTRKRDQVSNLVTGGLKSGMSWVLGAQPVNESSHPGQPR